jgi:beta propeller repeat protein
MRLSWAGAGLLAVGLVSGSGAPLIGQAQEGYSASEISIARRSKEQLKPRISGANVVWQDYRDLPDDTNITLVNADILGRNIDSNDDFKVTDNHTAARPAISGSRVVYTDSRNSVGSGLDIRGYDIASDDSFVVVDSTGDQDNAAIDGPLVVWQDKRGANWDIRGRDVVARDNFTVVERDFDQIKPAISGRRVVWEDYRDGADQPNIFVKNVDTDEIRRVTDNGESRDPAIAGDWIVFRTGNPTGDNQRVRAFNIATGENKVISDRVQLSGGPRISGTLVVWADRRNEEDYNVWGYNLATGVENVRILVESRDQTAVDISGTTVVWEDGRGDEPRDIRGARLTVPAGPAAPTTQPGGGGPAPGPCQFILGFGFLHGELNGIDGTCVTNEHDDPNGTGDRVQATINAANNVQGYMVWQRVTNTMRWTDGFQTYTYSSCGLARRLNTQAWVWERNPSIVVGGVVPPGGCALAP